MITSASFSSVCSTLFRSHVVDICTRRKARSLSWPGTTTVAKVRGSLETLGISSTPCCDVILHYLEYIILPREITSKSEKPR